VLATGESQRSVTLRPLPPDRRRVHPLVVRGKRLTSAEINAAWKKSGRGGVADNTLRKLVEREEAEARDREGWVRKQLQPARERIIDSFAAITVTS
jgi:hypothetical protein